MIKRICWMPHYIDRNFNGDSIGRNFLTKEVKVSVENFCKGKKDEFLYCKEIIEETMFVYKIVFFDGSSLRVFNPIEVEFK